MRIAIVRFGSFPLQLSLAAILDRAATARRPRRFAHASALSRRTPLGRSRLPRTSAILARRGLPGPQRLHSFPLPLTGAARGRALAARRKKQSKTMAEPFRRGGNLLDRAVCR